MINIVCLGIVHTSSFSPKLDQSYQEVEDVKLLKEKQNQLLKLKEDVDISLQLLMEEQKQIQKKIDIGDGS